MKKKLSELIKNQNIYLAKKYIKSLFSEEFKNVVYLKESINKKYYRDEIVVLKGRMYVISYDIYHKKGIYHNVHDTLKKDYGELHFYNDVFTFYLNEGTYEKIFIEEEKIQLSNSIKVNHEKEKRVRL